MITDLGPDTMGMHYPSYETATQPATQSTTQPTTTPVKPPTLSIKTTMLAHSGRDIVGQMFGRTFGLGLFNAAAYVASASVPCQIVAGGLGAVFGGLPIDCGAGLVVAVVFGVLDCPESTNHPEPYRHRLTN